MQTLSEHNSETGRLLIYSIHKPEILVDLSWLDLTGTDGIIESHKIIDAIRIIEAAAYRAGKERALGAMNDTMDGLWKTL